MTILILEDDVVFSLELEEVLLGLGYDVLKPIAENSKDGWRLVNELSPSLTIVDIHLERRYAGLEFARQMKSAGLPYILMTSDESDEVFETARHLHPYGYLIKPFGKKHLHRTIELALSHFEIKVGQEQEVFYGKNRTRELIRIPMGEISFVEAIGNYCYLQVKDQRYSIRIPLSSFLKKLPSTRFLQIHRRYVVSIPFIDSLNVGTNTISVGDKNLPIGGVYKKMIVNRVKIFAHRSNPGDSSNSTI